MNNIFAFRYLDLTFSIYRKYLVYQQSQILPIPEYNGKELDETKGKCFFLYQVIKSVVPRNFNVFLNNDIISIIFLHSDIRFFLSVFTENIWSISRARYCQFLNIHILFAIFNISKHSGLMPGAIYVKYYYVILHASLLTLRFLFFVGTSDTSQLNSITECFRSCP